MGAGVDVAESNDGALCLGPWLDNPRAPVGLEHQPHGAGLGVVDQPVEQGFGINAQIFGLFLFLVAEFVFKPAHHPVAPENLDFQ